MVRNEIYQFSIILILAFASTLPSSTANIAEYDDYWAKKAAAAWNKTLETYEPIPAKVVSHLNMHTSRTVKELSWPNSTFTMRRQLAHRVYKGPCMATNPIDQCWRCDPNWAENRFRLADCGLGFGHKAKGGKGGEIYVVTDPSDSDLVNPKPGTLRHAVTRNGPLWITFARSMVIRLTQELIVTSNKTIDGRGVSVHIAHGAGITVQYVNNVIIHGIKIYDIVPGSGGLIRDSADHFGLRTRSDGDGISVFGATDVWIDHVSMKQCSDGLIDVIWGSTGITISNGHFTDHNEAMLFGASDAHDIDKKMQITVVFNHFGKRMVQRMPRCRFGYVHVANNDYTHWNMYAIGGSMNPTIISQGNRYIAPPLNGYAKEVTKREYTPENVWTSWTWLSQGDIFLRGAFFIESGDKEFVGKHPELYDLVEAESGDKVAEMTRFAGTLNCKVGKAC